MPYEDRVIALKFFIILLKYPNLGSLFLDYAHLLIFANCPFLHNL